jgi:hypothetical protein
MRKNLKLWRYTQDIIHINRESMMRKKILFILLIFFILSHKGYSYYQEKHWYNSFFDKLIEKDVHNVRFFQVWVSPFQDHRAIALVGGNNERFDLWKEATEAFFDTALLYQDRIYFQYQILVDQKVKDRHKSLVDHWRVKYGEMVQWILLDSISYPQESSYQSGFQQCITGCASVCSDFLRLTQLKNDRFEIDIYMDIDTFSQSYNHKNTISSKHALGAHITDPGMYHTFHVTNKMVSYNCDLLVAYKLTLDKQQSLKNDMSIILKDYRPLYDHISQQYQRAALLSYDLYNASIEPLIQWAIDHPSRNINQYGLILGGIGPGFWKTQLQKNISHPYRYGFTEDFDNYFSWRDAQSYLPYAFETYESLLAYYQDENIAKNFLWLNISLYDYIMFKSNPEHLWAEEMREQCLNTWDAMASSLSQPLRYQEKKLFLMIEDMRSYEI